MPSIDRDGSRDRELVKHQHSFSSDGSRISIPMWDSSDPERAPPPLPLNPGSPNMTTRPNTSAHIAAAAKALEEKARESMPASSYTTNPMPLSKSPERSLIKGATHKRMQSLQPTGVRDLRSYLDGVRSPERSPERSSRALTPGRDLEKDYLSSVLDRSPSRNTTPTPPNRDIFKDSPALKPVTKSFQKAILGENTPPSATMLALQTMTIPREHLDPPLSNITNAEPPPAKAAPLSIDGLSSQLVSLTNIASNLQKEMAQLSRRSKDNATDLMTLKEATTARDEDIRKSLKDLVNTVAQNAHHGLGDVSRSASSLGLKDPNSTPTKQFTMPRMPSPSSFFMDERIGSPNPYSVEGAASVAMLEKIIREMVTKDGQERLLNSLSKLVDKATGETAKKVTELVEFIKDGSQNPALAGSAPAGSAAFQPSPGTGPLTLTRDIKNPHFPVPKGSDGVAYSSPKAADFVGDQMLNYLRKIKDSLTETGGMVAESKALTRDLRGEVLGMGRDLAHKLEELSGSGQLSRGTGQPDVASVIQESIHDIKSHIDKVMRERRRQSSSSTMTRATVDNNEVSDVIRRVLTEHGVQPQAAGHIDMDAILSAIREAYESYRPEIELQQFGLERDEILECLREGLGEYRGSGGITREEVLNTIQDTLQHVNLPQPINESHEIREEVVSAVRECLEELRPMLVPLPSQNEGITKQDIIDAITECLSQQDFNGPREIEINREELVHAVSVGLGSSGAADLHGDRVLEQLQTLVDDMHAEFKAYSSANGRDTEQVLDAVKDGLEHLRADIEGYVGKAQDVTQKDEIIENMRAELHQLRSDVEGWVAEGPRGDHALPRGEMLSYIKSEFEHLHEQLTSQFLPSVKDKEDIINAINAGFDGMKSQVAVRGLDLDENDEMNEAMKVEFEQLKEVLLEGSTRNKDEVLEKFQAALDELHAKLGGSLSVPNSEENVLAFIKDELAHLRETLATGLIRSGAADKDEIIDSVRELVDGLRTQINSTQNDGVREEIVQLRESLGNTLARSSDSMDKQEILEALRTGLDDIRTSTKGPGINEELLEAFRGELEQIRHSNGITQQNARADTEEVLDAVRLGLDDLRSHLEKKIENPDRQMSATNEIIDALNEGLEGLQSKMDNTSNTPVDMTVSYEILDLLKDGIASIRSDIRRLKEGDNVEEDRSAPTGNEVVLAEDPESMAAREIPTSREVVHESLRRNDLEKMEVMLSQLQVKVEAIDSNIQNPAPPEPAAVPLPADPVDLTNIEELLKDIQLAVTVIEERSSGERAADSAATKEDTDALETLMTNIKAKVEDMVLLLPDPEAVVTKENLEQVETVVRSANDAIESLAAKIDENSASKGDVAVVEVLVQDMKAAVDELKAAKSEEDALEKPTKEDIDVVSLLVTEVKAKIDEMRIPDPEDLPSKADVEQLTGLIHDFRESHDGMKDRYETDIAITAKAFDDRKKEAELLAENMSEFRLVLGDVQNDLKASFAEEGQSLETIKDSLKYLEDAAGSKLALNADVKELMETLSREFERAHGSLADIQLTQDDKSTAAMEKHDQAKEAIITGLCEKIDDRFNVLMTKYDDAQLLADEQTRTMKEKAAEQEQALADTKAMAEELRLTIDTLGSSITGMDGRFEEAAQKWSSDSDAVKGRLDDAISKLDTLHGEDKTEHEQTREEISKAVRSLDALQDNVTEYHPKFMVTLREILALVNQHYEHSQKAKDLAEQQIQAIAEDTRVRAEEIQNHFTRLPALLPPPPPPVEPVEKYDDSKLQEKIDKLLEQPPEKYDDSTVQEKLDKILGQPHEKYDDSTVHEKLDKILGQPPEKYDDATVQEKLDKLLHHADDAAESSASLKRLDEIHKQVMTTAAEVSEFVAKQTQLITDGHESKEREAEELALLLERRAAQKEQLETDIQGLKDEKDQLLSIVAALQVERENLANQKVRLTGEVSSLHTALEIRREELHAMDAKADALERRILNGIMDHSRALMMAKGKKTPTKANKRSNPDTLNDSKPMPSPSAAANGLSMALKPRPATRRNGPPMNPASRRILSLSQITNNVPTGAQAYVSPGSNLSTGGAGGLKRSHSVKTNYIRKVSWAGRPNTTTVDGVDKENERLDEESEGELEQHSTALVHQDHERDIDIDASSADEADDAQSETGTQRRHSYGTAHSEEGYSRRSSYEGDGSEYTYGSGSSYMTGSDIDRRTSYGSTTRSTLGNETETIDEDAEDSRSESEGEESGSEEGEEESGDQTVMAIEAPPAPATEDHAPTVGDGAGDVGTATTGEEGKGKAGDVVVWSAPSDSGLGTDLMSAGVVEPGQKDYFRRAVEEEGSVVD